MDGWRDGFVACVGCGFFRAGSEEEEEEEEDIPGLVASIKNSFRILNQTALTRDCGRQRQETLLLIIYWTLSRYILVCNPAASTLCLCRLID